MASRHTPAHPFQGVLVHDERFNTGTIDPSRTTATQRGPRPDQPQPATNKSFMQQEAFGELGTARDFDLQSTKAGPPVGSNSGGRFAWKEKAESDTAWRGHSNHNKITGWRNIDGYASGTSFPTAPHAIRLPSGTVVCAVNDALEIGAYRLTEEGESWSSYIKVADTLAVDSNPCLILLPNDRILCFVFSDGLEFFYSDDEGQTWLQGGKNIPGPAVDLAGKDVSMRGIYHRGYITLIVGTNDTTDDLVHLVSDDLGGSFTEVETITRRRWPDLFVDSAGRVGMVYVDESNAARRASKGTAFSKFAEDPSWDTLIGTCDSGTMGGSNFHRSICCAVDEEGYLWIYMRLPSPSRYRMKCIRYNRDSMAVDYDESYAYNRSGVNHPMEQGTDDGVFLTDYCCVPHKGALLILGIHEANNSSTDKTLSELRMGGYSNLPTRVAGAWGYWEDTTSPVVQGMVWLALEDAATVTPWTLTNTGTNSTSLTLEGMEISTTTGTRWYHRTSTGTTVTQTTRSYAHVRCRAHTLTSLASSQVALKLTGSDGTNSFSVELRLSETSFRVLDDVSGATIGSDGTLVSGVLYDFFVILEVGVLEVWYKKATEVLWTKSHDSGGAKLTARSLIVNEIRWGNQAFSTAVSVWAFVLSSIDSFDFAEGLVGMVRPSGMNGRPYSTWPLTLMDGARLRSKGSSTYLADAWTVSARHDYGLDKLDPVLWPSPKQTWRSLDDSAEATITWAPNDGEPTALLCSTIGCYIDLGDSGVETVYWEASTDGTTWATLATMTTSSGLAPSSGTMTYLLSGDWVRPAAGTAAGQQFIQMDELSAVRLQDDGTFDEVLSVSQNAAGVWRGADARKAEMRVAGDLSGHTGSPQEITLLTRSVSAVVHNVSAAYRFYRLRVPVQGTVGGCFEASAVVMGPVLMWGQVSGWGRRIRLETNVERYEAAGGSRRTSERSTPKRVVDFAWPDGWDMSELTAADPDPTFLSAYSSSADPFTIKADATLVERTLHRARSGAVPAVYLPSIAEAGSASMEAQIMTARELMVYGTLEADNITRQNLVGDEWSDEVVAVSSLTLKEL